MAGSISGGVNHPILNFFLAQRNTELLPNDRFSCISQLFHDIVRRIATCIQVIIAHISNCFSSCRRNPADIDEIHGLTDVAPNPLFARPPQPVSAQPEAPQPGELPQNQAQPLDAPSSAPIAPPPSSTQPRCTRSTEKKSSRRWRGSYSCGWSAL